MARLWRKDSTGSPAFDDLDLAELNLISVPGTTNYGYDIISTVIES